ncbi:MAG: ABC transporter ATP-binding protein [Clostridiales Family XIII bacterium]|nr:ABC transporter ATP-binding protein [Clostridiales Family XIII bacterium]
MIFEVKNGNFGYGKRKTTLRDISFSLRRDSILSILGPNGAGKTTLLKCMLGLLKWTSGDSYIEGVPVSGIEHRELWKRIGYVPQAKLSAFAYTVIEMTLLGRSAHLGLFEHPNDADREIAESCLDRIGISHLRDRLCSRISGGELQMALIARALATDPSILVLDEPESNLDFKNQLIVMDTIRSLRDDHHISSVVNTHYPEHALSISDSVIILRSDGTIISGNAKSVVTEENLEKAFGVNVKLHDITSASGNYTCVMPISIA